MEGDEWHVQEPRAVSTSLIRVCSLLPGPHATPALMATGREETGREQRLRMEREHEPIP